MIYQRKKQESIRELWMKEKIKSEQSSLKSHILRRTLCNFLFLYMFLLPCSNSSTNTQYPDGVRHLPKGDFPSGKLPKVRLGFWGTTGCNEGRVLWLGWARGPSAAARTCSGSSVAVWTDLGSCRLENYTFWKLPLGKMPLGKYLTSIPTRELTFQVHVYSDFRHITGLILQNTGH